MSISPEQRYKEWLVAALAQKTCAVDGCYNKPAWTYSDLLVCLSCRDELHKEYIVKAKELREALEKPEYREALAALAKEQTQSEADQPVIVDSRPAS